MFGAKVVFQQAFGQGKHLVPGFSVSDGALARRRLLNQEKAAGGPGSPAVQPVAYALIAGVERLQAAHPESAVRFARQFDFGREEADWPPAGILKLVEYTQ
jgi:hypothetical protein